jgi:hypothetical protein
MSITYSIRAADGLEVTGEINDTIHQLPAALADFSNR